MKRRRAAVREDHGDKMDDKLQQQRNTEERPAAALPEESCDLGAPRSS